MIATFYRELAIDNVVFKFWPRGAIFLTEFEHYEHMVTADTIFVIHYK